MDLTIGVLAGGTPTKIACHPEVIRAHLAVIADVTKELALLRVDSERVLTLPLSDWGTVAALVKDAKVCGLTLSPDLDNLLAHLPTASLEEGMCQVALWGDLAIQVIEAQGRLEELKEEIFKRALWIAKGELTAVRMVEWESQAGGTGKGAGPRLAHILVRTFLERSPATVIWEKLYIGNLTFVGLGNNVLPNAVHLWADVADVLNGDRNAREIRELWLTELPLRQREMPIGAHKEIRDALVGVLAQALFSSKVREEIGRRRSNRSFEHPLGSLKIVRADFWDFLGEEQLLLAGTTHHIQELRSLEARIPTADVCQRVEVTLEESGHWRGGAPKEIADLLRTSAEKPGLLQTEIWATPDYSGRVVAFFAENESVLFDTLLHAPPPSSPEEYLQTRCQYTSIQRVLTEALDQERERRPVVEASLTEATQALKRAVGVLYPETWWEKGVSFLSSLWPWADDPILVFGRALSRYRSAATEALQSRAKMAALSGALAQLDAESARYKGEIDRTVTFLEHFSQGASRSTALVIFKPLAAVFAALLQAAGAQDQEKLRQILHGSIGGVTQKGLAQIVGVKDAELREVLGKLATGTPPYQGPMWGGRSDRKSPRHRFFVLPPLESQTRTAVFREAVATGLSSQVVVLEADTLVAGLTIVVLEVYEVERLDEVFTALYRHYAEKALGSESRSLFTIPDRHYETVCNGATT